MNMRTGNPTREALEALIRDIEGGVAVLLLVQGWQPSHPFSIIFKR